MSSIQRLAVLFSAVLLIMVIYHPVAHGQAGQALGGLTQDEYCQSRGYQRSSLMGGTWYCVRSSGSMPIDHDDACRWQYRRQDVYARWGSPTDPYSIKCYVRPSAGITPPTMPPPSVVNPRPTGTITLTCVGDQLTISWTANLGSTDYWLQVSTSPARIVNNAENDGSFIAVTGTPQWNSPVGNITSKTLAGAVPNVTYYAVVSPKGADGLYRPYGGSSGPLASTTCRMAVAPPPPPPPAAAASLSVVPEPGRIERGAGQTGGLTWVVTETRGVGVTLRWRSWEVYGCLDKGCLNFTNALYGTERADLNPGLRVNAYGSTSFPDVPGPGGCGEGYAATLLAMSFHGTDDNVNGVLSTASRYLRIDCVAGPQDRGPVDFGRYCEYHAPGRQPAMQDGSHVCAELHECEPGGAISLCEFDPNAVQIEDQQRMDEFCQWLHGPSAYARKLDPTKPYSWTCFTG
jgi:hypothetical protein